MTDDQAIIMGYGHDKPDFSYICRGLRQIAVDSSDERVRKMLLRKGPKYLSRIQAVIFLIVKYIKVDILLDIGSNYGEVAFAVPKGATTKIVGYEANPDLHRYLEKSRQINTDIRDITFVCRAVSDGKAPEIDFFVNRRWSGMSSAIQHKTAGVEKITIPATSIDNELKDLYSTLQTVLIKIDIEGYEPMAMKGASEAISKIPNLIILMEFDYLYIKRGGVDPVEFLNSMLEKFCAYDIYHEFKPVKSMRDIVGDELCESLHTDILFVKSNSDAVNEILEGTLYSVNFKDLVRIIEADGHVASM